ncbi:hypothetical protein GQR58_030554 [Nymphon striatum]|nr:hypothetical protein GQR58_030554 [Nymphon striatum]
MLTAVLATACTDAPEPGDLAAFCSLLETGSGLTPSPTAEDLDRLALVAPPAVRPTIDALQNRARDFNCSPRTLPILKRSLTARFDPQASSEQAALDRYALSSCGIAADRPAPTRWNSFAQDNYADAGLERPDHGAVRGWLRPHRNSHHCVRRGAHAHRPGRRCLPGHVFEVRDDDFLYLLTDTPEEDQRAKVMESVQRCPKQAIAIAETDDSEE